MHLAPALDLVVRALSIAVVGVSLIGILATLPALLDELRRTGDAPRWPF